MIIAISGYGQAGKDTVADILVSEYGFFKYSWADTLRMAASALNPIVWVSVEDGKVLRYNDAIEEVGYNRAKVEYPEVRRVLQRLGTEVGRNMICDTVWVDATLSRIARERTPEDNIVIPDTRFLNEVNAVKSHLRNSNFTVRVSRQGVGPAGDHPSETELDDYDFDYRIHNDGSIEDLRDMVSSVYRSAKNI